MTTGHADESRRLKTFRDILERMADESVERNGEEFHDPVISDLSTIYRDILMIDQTEERREELDKIWEILRFAWINQGSAKLLQIGPDTYRVSFIGGTRGTDKRDVLEADLEIHGSRIGFKGYKLL